MFYLNLYFWKNSFKSSCYWWISHWMFMWKLKINTWQAWKWSSWRVSSFCQIYTKKRGVQRSRGSWWVLPSFCEGLTFQELPSAAPFGLSTDKFGVTTSGNPGSQVQVSVERIPSLWHFTVCAHGLACVRCSCIWIRRNSLWPWSLLLDGSSSVPASWYEGLLMGSRPTIYFPVPAESRRYSVCCFTAACLGAPSWFALSDSRGQTFGYISAGVSGTHIPLLPPWTLNEISGACI